VRAKLALQLTSVGYDHAPEWVCCPYSCSLVLVCLEVASTHCTTTVYLL